MSIRKSKKSAEEQVAPLPVSPSTVDEVVDTSSPAVPTKREAELAENPFGSVKGDSRPYDPTPTPLEPFQVAHWAEHNEPEVTGSVDPNSPDFDGKIEDKVALANQSISGK